MALLASRQAVLSVKPMGRRAGASGFMELAYGREYGRDRALFSTSPMIRVAGAETFERVIVA